MIVSTDQNHGFNALFSYQQTHVFFSEADVVSLNSSFLPAWTPLFLKLETLVLKLWFPDYSPTCPANIWFPFRKQTFFSRNNLCFGSQELAFHPQKCVFFLQKHTVFISVRFVSSSAWNTQTYPLRGVYV